MSRAIQALILRAQGHPWQHDPWTCHIPRDVVAFPRETQQAQGGFSTPLLSSVVAGVPGKGQALPATELGTSGNPIPAQGSWDSPTLLLALSKMT